MPKVLVLYASFTGKTQFLAEAIAKGAKDAGAEVTLNKASEATAMDLYKAEAVAFGTPNPFGSMAGEMKALIERVWGEYYGGRPMAAFVVPSAEGTATLEQLEMLAGRLGFVKAAPGVVAPREEVESFEESCRHLGAALVAALE
jgi:multimeric flavodoxin WrbA